MQQLLIVGAGPVGLTAAAELARYGVPLRIVDRSPYPSRTSKALVIWSRTLELMDRMGCTAAFLAAGLEARGATIRDGIGVLGHNSFDHVASPPSRSSDDSIVGDGVPAHRTPRELRRRGGTGGRTRPLR